MKTDFKIRIGLVKPVKALVVGRTIKTTDRAWKEAMFGLGGSRKRIGGVRLGTIDGQPLALIAELQSEIVQGRGIWTIDAEKGPFAFIGVAAVYNDAGFGPASLGISIDRLKELVSFFPSPEKLEQALRRTKDVEESDDIGRRLV